MRRSALFKALAIVALMPLAPSAQPWLSQEGDLWVRTYRETAAAKPRLHIVSHGPVMLEGNVAANFEYVVKVTVHARSREEARRLLEKADAEPHVEQQKEWLVLTAPGRYAMSSVEVRAPKLVEVVVSNSDGPVEVYGIDGTLSIGTGADLVKVDRIHGNCSVTTGGGDIRVGTVDGFLHCSTGAGAITAKSIRGEADLSTNGGDITVMSIGGAARAQTGGGTVRLDFVNGPVTAINGGGPIVVGQAAGVVTTRNMAGPVTVGQAAGIRCDSANGGILLGRITGPMHVSTSVGSIVADLAGSKLADSYLATGSGDITVKIPSNLGVTVSVENQMADSIRRIVSDFSEVQPRLRGMHLEAQGRVNGGGPLLQISASSGTVFLRRTQ